MRETTKKLGRQTINYLIGVTHDGWFRFLLELRTHNGVRVLGRFDILRTHAWLGKLDPRVRGFTDQQRIELFVIVIDTLVEGIVHMRPAQGLLMIVPQVLRIVVVTGGGDTVAGKNHLFLRDQGCLAVERTRIRRNRRVGRTI